MTRYWLVDQHGSEGPTALVEADGRMRVIDVIAFGTGLVALNDQQNIWDRVIGSVVPTMKPFVPASSIKSKGEAPHEQLVRVSAKGKGPAGRGINNQDKSSSGRSAGGGALKGSRGDR